MKYYKIKEESLVFLADEIRRFTKTSEEIPYQMIVNNLSKIGVCYVSSSEPSSSDGADGDFWVVTDN